MRLIISILRNMHHKQTLNPVYDQDLQRVVDA